MCVSRQRYNCYKHHWSDTRKSVSLEVTPGGIDQIDPQTNRVVCSYDYRSVEGFAEVNDYQGGFCILYGGFSRLVRSWGVGCVCLLVSEGFIVCAILSVICVYSLEKFHCPGLTRAHTVLIALSLSLIPLSPPSHPSFTSLSPPPHPSLYLPHPTPSAPVCVRASG